MPIKQMPIKHRGVIDSDKVVGRYLDAVASYAPKVDARVPLWRRVWRWGLGLFA